MLVVEPGTEPAADPDPTIPRPVPAIPIGTILLLIADSCLMRSAAMEASGPVRRAALVLLDGLDEIVYTPFTL